MIFRQILRLFWFNSHRQNLNGTIDPAIYQSVLQELSVYAGDLLPNANADDIIRRQKLMEWVWKSEYSFRNPAFQRMVDAAFNSFQSEIAAKYSSPYPIPVGLQARSSFCTYHDKLARRLGLLDG